MHYCMLELKSSIKILHHYSPALWVGLLLRNKFVKSTSIVYQNLKRVEVGRYKKPEFHLPISISRVISKLSQLLAILGATLSKFGTMPL